MDGRTKNARILNLGSGNKPREDAVNVDRNKDSPGVDVVCDIEEGLPFEDNMFDGVVCFHILEHIRKLPELMSEIWRVCKHGAVISIDAPHWTNPMFWDDITHVRPFSERVADFLCSSTFDGVRGVNGKFEIINNIVQGEPWSIKKPTVCVIDLIAIKEGV